MCVVGGCVCVCGGGEHIYLVPFGTIEEGSSILGHGPFGPGTRVKIVIY